MARLLAKSLNCQNRKEGGPEPCNKCNSCLEITGNTSLDLIEIDAASHRGIDEMRGLRDGIKFAPSKSKYKVFVIDECLTEDHLITMLDGKVKKISEIKNGEKVAAVDLKTGNVVDGKVTNWFRRKTKQLLEIKTPQTYLKCTPKHHLWVIRDSEFLLIEAKDLKIGDFLLSPLNLPHVQKNNLTPEQLSLLALIQCDGHVSKDSITVQIEINKDKNYFQEVVEKGLKAWRMREKPVIKRTSRGTRLIRVYSKELKKTLIKLGCPKGKKGTRIDIPDSVFQAPLESIKAYVDACFCCEGNLDFNKSLNLYRLHFNSTSEIFVKKLQLLLKKFGISSSFLKIKKKDKNCSGQSRLTLSHYNLQIFHQKIGLSLVKKAKILANCSLEKEKQDTIPIEKIVIERQREIKLPYLLRASLGIYPDDRQHLSRKAVVNFMDATNSPYLNKYLQFRYEKINKIRTLNKEENVYDFTVETAHTFIVNGICSSNCHQLTKEAANALLKTLEEPPSHAIFILATTEIHKMIPTIISRCQHFDFRKLTLQEIIKRLEFIAKKEAVSIGKEALELIALNAGGSIRDAESIFGQILTFEDKDREIKPEEVKSLLGLVEINLISQFCDFLSQKKVSEALNFLNSAIEKGVDLQELTKSLINYLRQGLILKIMGPESANPLINGLTKEELEKLQKQADLFKEEELRNIIELFLEAENKIKYSSIPQLPLELAIIEAIEPNKE